MHCINLVYIKHAKHNLDKKKGQRLILGGAVWMESIATTVKVGLWLIFNYYYD